jgi:hypothetical protein
VRARFLVTRPALNVWPGALSDLLAPALAAAVVVAAAILLMQSGYITSSGYRLNQLERTRADWERQNQQLAAEVAQLRSLERADTEARSRWKMEPAASVLYLDLTATGAAGPQGR